MCRLGFLFGMKNKKEIPFSISPKKKEEGRYCCAYGCTNQPVARKGGLCHCHYKRKRRVLDPVAVRYNQFKAKAKARGKAFTITLEEFRAFCNKTGYIVTKGMRGMAATVDRIDVTKGYTLDNIQILTLSANVKKWHQEDKHQLQPDYADCPF